MTAHQVQAGKGTSAIDAIAAKYASRISDGSAVTILVMKQALNEYAGSLPEPVFNLNGHQLRTALECINPDGPTAHDQLDDCLTFGVVPHEDDAGKVETGMCGWNDDTEGVLPLSGDYAWQGHPDEIAVASWSDAMGRKMARARAKGRDGWQDPVVCTAENLNDMLIEHLAKGDPLDVAILAMMLWSRGERTTAAAGSIRPIVSEEDHAAALAEAQTLMDAAPGTLRSDRLQILSLLIGAYEDEHFPLPAGSAAVEKAVPASKSLTSCAAGRDGECGHAQYPQLRDNEPTANGRHCPLDNHAGGDD